MNSRKENQMMSKPHTYADRDIHLTTLQWYFVVFFPTPQPEKAKDPWKYDQGEVPQWVHREQWDSANGTWVVQVHVLQVYKVVSGHAAIGRRIIDPFSVINKPGSTVFAFWSYRRWHRR